MPMPRNVHETLLNRISFVLSVVLSIALTAVSGFAQSSARDLAGMVDAALDGAREKREQEAAPASIRDIFAKAKAEEEDGNVNFCGFYVGMAKADADALVSHYGLRPGESALYGDPVYDIQFSLRGVRRITKGGNTFDDLCQAVANRVGNLKHKYDGGGWEDKSETWYEYKTIDGVRLTMSEERLTRTGIVAGFRLCDGTGNIKAEAERKAREAAEAAERKAREEREAAERKAREEREAAERKKAEEERQKHLAELRDSLPKLLTTIVDSMVSIPGKDYRMGKTEVTQALWEAVMGDNPSNFKRADNPVEAVSWNDCQEFLKKFNVLSEVKASGLVFRLPTEEEWKYACRAGATGDYCRLADGTEITKDTLDRVAWYDDNSGGRTHPVGQKVPNAFGLYDMHGNVWEWTQTADGESRVVRGGGWDDSAGNCESSNRYRYSPDGWYNGLGFRLCAEKR